MFVFLLLIVLCIFELVVCQLSFKVVVEEFVVMLIVVFYQICLLEVWFGVLLFQCLLWKVCLIDCGEWLFCSLYGVLLEILQSVDMLCLQCSVGNLMVFIILVFVVFWLVLCFGCFYVVYLQINLCLDINCEVFDLYQDVSIDLVICYSFDDYLNFYGFCLFDECFVVYGLLVQVVLVVEWQLILISVCWYNFRFYVYGWEVWCVQVGEDWMEGQLVICQYDEEYYVLQVVIVGQGLVLVSLILVLESVVSGLL